MEAKPKRDLWIFITICALNIIIGLFENAQTVILFQPFRHWDCINRYFEGSDAESTNVPAIVGILACDLLLILSAIMLYQLPKKSIAECKNSVENRGRRTHIAIVATSLVSFKL